MQAGATAKSVWVEVALLKWHGPSWWVDIQEVPHLSAVPAQLDESAERSEEREGVTLARLASCDQARIQYQGHEPNPDNSPSSDSPTAELAKAASRLTASADG